MKRSSIPHISKPVSTDQLELVKKIGRKVRELRKQKNKNYKNFALEHNINKVTLLGIEHGKPYFFQSLLSVLNALDITPKDFFSLLDETK
jgi:transcriptional regulator with XRE-family HTH domain